MKISVKQSALLLLLSGTLLFSCVRNLRRDDTGWSGGKPEQQTQYEGMQKRSQYVVVRDGTQLAVTVYLPQGLPRYPDPSASSVPIPTPAPWSAAAFRS